MVPRFPIATFSIVAYNPDRQEWGVAVQSKFLACAAVVSWARAGAGAVAVRARGAAGAVGEAVAGWAVRLVRGP